MSEGDGRVSLLIARHNYFHASELLAWRRRRVAARGNHPVTLKFYENEVKYCLDQLWEVQERLKNVRT